MIRAFSAVSFVVLAAIASFVGALVYIIKAIEEDWI